MGEPQPVGRVCLVQHSACVQEETCHEQHHLSGRSGRCGHRGSVADRAEIGRAGLRTIQGDPRRPAGFSAGLPQLWRQRLHRPSGAEKISRPWEPDRPAGVFWLRRPSPGGAHCGAIGQAEEAGSGKVSPDAPGSNGVKASGAAMPDRSLSGSAAGGLSPSGLRRPHSRKPSPKKNPLQRARDAAARGPRQWCQPGGRSTCPGGRSGRRRSSRR